MLPRIDFNPQDFLQLIEDKGLNILWQQNIPCPCVDPATKHFVDSCTLCNGTGRYYFSSKTIKGLILRQQKDINPEHHLGTLALGEAYLTVAHDNFMALFDKVTNLDSQVMFNDLVQHDIEDGDWLTYPPVGNVIFAVTSIGRNTPAIPLVQGTDFSIGADGKITWITNHVTTQEQAVTFRYFMNPVWVVTNTPNYVRDTWVKFNNPQDTYARMPVRFVIRLEYLGGGPGDQGGQV